MFTDHVKVTVTAGKGGNGVVAWRREKYIPKGGPAGGNGGKGGSVYFQAERQLLSLEWYRDRRQFHAENGRQGGPNQQQGRAGVDLVLKVPCGTLVKDANTGEVLCDLVEDKQKWLVCSGGRGGRGNASFKSSTHQAPHFCTPGTEGESRAIELELKLIADVGFVGFPNAGKSTLFSVLAHVNVKIAAYPFTTLFPNVSYLEKDNYTRLFLADIPGIIEDAHQNRGLGLEFLRHIERTNLLIFVLDVSGMEGRTPAEDFEVLRREIGEYNLLLLERPYLVVLNKVDLEEAQSYIDDFYEKHPLPSSSVFELSALTGQGVERLRAYLASL